MNYFNLGYFSFWKTTNITLENVPFINGHHIQHKENNRYDSCEKLTSSGIVCDSSKC